MNQTNQQLKVLELFAGMGSPAKALKNLNIDHQIIDAVEIDEKAMKAYNSIHSTNFEIQDIQKWDKNLKCDYLHASTPCQAFSTAGKNVGSDDSRGKILWDHTLRIIKKTEPKFVSLENVKGLVSKKHKNLLDWFLNELENLGFKNTWKILNSKDFGVPQNRERVFIISSKLNEPSFESFIPNYKPISSILDANAKWIKPKNIKQKDNLFYFKNELSQYNGKIIELNTNLINKNFEPTINKIATIKKQNWNDFNFDDLEDLNFNSAKNFTNINGISGTLRASPDAKHECKLIDVSFQQDKYFLDIEGITGALTTTSPDFKNKILYQSKDAFIFYRRLTSLEVVKLMGFNEYDFNKMIQNNLSENQICKISGNSIVVNVMEFVIKNLLKVI